jgi:regulatory protein
MPSEDALKLALRRLVARDRTEREIRDYLAAKGFTQIVIDEIIARLRSWGYLNDHRVGLAWARDRFEQAYWGPGRVRLDLLRRGLTEEDARRVTQDAMEHSTEEELAARAARRYIRTHPSADGSGAAQRLAGYLARRGYSADVVSRIVSSIRRGSSDPSP